MFAQVGLQLGHVEHGVAGGDRAVHHPSRLDLRSGGVRGTSASTFAGERAGEDCGLSLGEEQVLGRSLGEEGSARRGSWEVRAAMPQ